MGQSWKSFLRGKRRVARAHKVWSFEAQEVRVFISSRIQLAMMIMTMMLSSTKGDAANSMSVLCVKVRSHQDKMKPGGLIEAVVTSVWVLLWARHFFISYLHINPFSFQNTHKKAPIW